MAISRDRGGISEKPIKKGVGKSFHNLTCTETHSHLPVYYHIYTHYRFVLPTVVVSYSIGIRQPPTDDDQRSTRSSVSLKQQEGMLPTKSLSVLLFSFLFNILFFTGFKATHRRGLPDSYKRKARDAHLVFQHIKM